MKRITLYPLTTTRTTFNIYDDKLRQLLRLPVRTGEIKEVTWANNRLTVTFEKQTSNKFTIK